MNGVVVDAGTAAFAAGRLGGMHANKATVALSELRPISELARAVTDSANVSVVVATPGT